MLFRRIWAPILRRTCDRKYLAKLMSSRYSLLTKKEITQLKKLLNEMENKYRDPESKTKIKNLKADAQKQI
jgi:hypothetical protein